MFLFLKLAVGLHHALPLLLHHPLSGHGRLVCGADGVPEKRVEQQRLGFLLEDRRREMRRHSKEFFTSTAWCNVYCMVTAAGQLTGNLTWAFLGLLFREGGAIATSPKGTLSNKTKAFIQSLIVSCLHLLYIVKQGSPTFSNPSAISWVLSHMKQPICYTLLC